MAKTKRLKIATKFTEDQLVGYFNEHILYELLVLRFAHDRLSTTTQILWNTAFSALSARNLYEFLNNKGSKTRSTATNTLSMRRHFDCLQSPILPARCNCSMNKCFIWAGSVLRSEMAK